MQDSLDEELNGRGRRPTGKTTPFDNSHFA